MSDSIPPMSGTPAATAATSAGAMLRQARQAQGMHIAALAAAIKVSPRKLEMLESDQFDKLPDATFTRALAQTVCRALKIDPVPVLALLPSAVEQRLEEVGAGLNAPFRDRPGRMAPKEWPLLGNPVFWLVGLIVLAAAAIYLLPARLISKQALEGFRIGSASAPAASASEPAIVGNEVFGPSGQAASDVPAMATPVASSNPLAAPNASDSVEAANVSSNAPASTAASASASGSIVKEPVNVNGALQLRPIAQSWVEVTDSRGVVLISRLVEPGEAVGLDGTAPFKLKIGNASATVVTYRGRPVELAPYVRDNVARFELK